MFGPWLVAWKMKRVGMLGKVAVSQVNSNNLYRYGLRSTATAGLKLRSTATARLKLRSTATARLKVHMSTATVRLKLC